MSATTDGWLPIREPLRAWQRLGLRDWNQAFLYIDRLARLCYTALAGASHTHTIEVML
jgi:hypothetical protein